jgi:tRNA U34 5-methylaminomethyl-2-thiouridine-forming methyltransferase MnmC
MDQNSFQPNIVRTKDGSSSLYSSRFNQHYHNPNGAVSESQHVFFDVPGTAKAFESTDFAHIFEIGFGTGLNLLLTLDYLNKAETKSANTTKVSYTSIEAFPIKPDIADELNFGNHSTLNQNRSILTNIFKNIQPGLNKFTATPSVNVTLFNGFFDEYIRQDLDIAPVDFIFHDAFSPTVNPELWTPEVFLYLKKISHEQTVLSTYCASSGARAAMAVAGWKIARARGALGKREMTIASPSEKKLIPFKRVNEQRLADRYHRGDFNKNQDL